MVNKIKTLILIAGFLISGMFFMQLEAAPKFVKVENAQFILDGKPYYYIGTNFWYGAILGSKGKDGNRARLIKELDFMKKAGITNLRVMVGAEGPEDNDFRVQPTLQPEPGKYNQEQLDGLDFLLAEMGKRKMVAILALNNSWDWSGGIGQYLEWNGYGEALCIKAPDNDWNKYQAYQGQFNECEKCIEQYHNHIRFILGRTNAYTKKKYTEDPAIMAWEIGNEPRAFGDKFIPAFEKMMKETAALIKSIDKNHLLTTGSEGQMGSEGSMELFERIHTTPDMDYLTFHVWPLNWGWIKQNDIASTIDNAITKTNEYIDNHIAVAKKLNKPIVAEEFGLPRDKYNFTPADPALFRDKYYENIFKQVAESSKNKGILAGANFWSWGGFGRPARIWYKRGDDYLGDPPCEEQGVNSVFNSDKTVDLIKKYNNEIGR
ncbi:MAG TPA: cellulase family glycosylhydrolase [Prolixibacteraceae bacterium]|nr:cellulase family glycosylhydrolase [Prolixibacteraceae bacterium]